MELWAILASLTHPFDVTIHTDSKYVIAGVRSRRHVGEDLWEELFAWLDVHRVRFVKIKSAKFQTQAHHLARDAIFLARKTG